MIDSTKLSRNLFLVAIFGILFAGAYAFAQDEEEGSALPLEIINKDSLSSADVKIIDAFIKELIKQYLGANHPNKPEKINLEDERDTTDATKLLIVPLKRSEQAGFKVLSLLP